ncbi:MAG: hypothetical protein ACYTHJ_07005 [Planctomycetota bacterium]
MIILSLLGPTIGGCVDSLIYSDSDFTFRYSDGSCSPGRIPASNNPAYCCPLATPVYLGSGVCGPSEGREIVVTQPGYCPWINDGECDEPQGSGLCPAGSDEADCGPRNPVCPGGSVPVDSECVCPIDTIWDGMACVPNKKPDAIADSAEGTTCNAQSDVSVSTSVGRRACDPCCFTGPAPTVTLTASNDSNQSVRVFVSVYYDGRRGQTQRIDLAPRQTRSRTLIEWTCESRFTNMRYRAVFARDDCPAADYPS